MNVLLAEEMGMCFGVRDALKILDAVDSPHEVTIHGQLVHNEVVLSQLLTRGFRMVEETQRQQLPQSEAVLITAHGISNRERARLESAGKKLIDTTCPLVRRVHEAAMRMQREGCHVLLIGRIGHVEVRGIVEDLQRFDVIEAPAEARAYSAQKLAILCQTTVAPRTVAAVRAAIVAANPGAEIRFVDTTCHPTKNRQTSVEKLIPLVETMVVVGGRNSNNTRELVELCRQRGLKTHLVRDANDLRAEWFRGVSRVGLTAGTSTLDQTIREVKEKLQSLPQTDSPAIADTWSSQQWKEYFTANAQQVREIPWADGANVTADQRTLLAESLTAWQLGETSDGRRMLATAKKHALRTDDPVFVEVIQLFIKEEQRHGELLGRFLDLAGIPRVRHYWGDTAFRAFRHLLPTLESSSTPVVMVETLAVIYYNAIRKATSSTVLRQVCAQILADEGPHIRFQCEQLAAIFAGRRKWLRIITHGVHLVMFLGIVTAVWIAHRKAFRAGGYSFARYWRTAWRKMRRAWQAMKPERYRIEAVKERRALSHSPPIAMQS